MITVFLIVHPVLMAHYLQPLQTISFFLNQPYCRNHLCKMAKWICNNNNNSNYCHKFHWNLLICNFNNCHCLHLLRCHIHISNANNNRLLHHNLCLELVSFIYLFIYFKLNYILNLENCDLRNNASNGNAVSFVYFTCNLILLI